MEPVTLGWHWIVDAFGCDQARLASLVHLRQVLESLPAALGLTRVGGVQVFEHLPEDPQQHCLVGLAMIAESHLAIHARPKARVLHADLFSCARFDQLQALKWLQTAYSFSTWHTQSLTRGAPGAPEPRS